MAARKSKFTGKQRMFIDAYFACGFNATEAARRAGYKGDNNVLGVTASENLRNPKIQGEINRRMKEHRLGADEVLSRLSEYARADLGDFVYTIPGTQLVMLDVPKAKAAGKSNLIKKITWSFSGGVSIELHDPMRALELLGKHHKLFTERIELEWVKELQERGLDPEQAVESLADEFARLIADGARRTVR